MMNWLKLSLFCIIKEPNMILIAHHHAYLRQRDDLKKPARKEIKLEEQCVLFTFYCDFFGCLIFTVLRKYQSLSLK